jgi:chemotaxis protein methyltransferase CheR
VNKFLAEVTELVRRQAGIVLPATRETAILAAVDRTAPGLSPGAFLRAASDQVHGRNLVDRLIDEVTVQETTFVRDRGQLNAIPWHKLLQGARAAGSRAVRVWSAACATGEEAYTLALLADQAFAQEQAPVDVLGTDISGAALAAAAAGRYRDRAVRSLEPTLLSRHLDRQADGAYLVRQRLRALVRFSRHNLARGPFPPRGETPFDLIACRNVLIYFERPMVGRVIESLERSLRPGGTLMLGAADALQRSTAGPAVPVARSPGPPWTGSTRPLRRPLGRSPARSREERLAAALDAAGKGDRDTALAGVAVLLASNPLDTDAHFVEGLLALAAGEPARAAAALRRALYTDARFALAAFTLGRAYDEMGDAPAARRAYQRALRTLDPEDRRHEAILQQVDIGDIAAACRARLGGWS